MRPTTREERSRRDALIRLLYRRGLSAIELAVLTRFSRQRIHQICQDSLQKEESKKSSR